MCSIFKQKIDILLVSEIKIDDTFPLAQFCVEGCSTPYRLDRTCKGGGLLFYVRDNITSKQIILKFIENEAFEGFFVEINLRKKSGFFATFIIQIKIKFCVTYMLLAKL